MRNYVCGDHYFSDIRSKKLFITTRRQFSISYVNLRHHILSFSLKISLEITGNNINKPIDYFNHLMDALRYGMERMHGDNFSF